MKSILLLTLAALLSVGCDSQKPTPLYELNETAYTFGTLVDVTIIGVDEQQANDAYTALLEDFSYMHNTWHAWQNNALRRINNLLKTGANFTLTPSVFPLIQQAQALSKQSENLFNPAIGEMVALWGFHSSEPDEFAIPPSDDEINALLNAAPKMADIDVEGLNMRGNNAHLQLDFGAFAKGVAVDVAIEHLRELGIKHAIVNAGGDLRAIGQHDDRPWHIGIRDPRSEGIIAALDIGDGESVFTSGDYERFFEHEGKRYHHIIDPRTGYPATGTRSVTVIHDSGAVADAAATALFIAGADNWQRIAKSMSIEHVMLIDEQGIVHMTPAMAERIEFLQPPGKIRLSE